LRIKFLDFIVSLASTLIFPPKHVLIFLYLRLHLLHTSHDIDVAVLSVRHTPNSCILLISGRLIAVTKIVRGHAYVTPRTGITSIDTRPGHRPLWHAVLQIAVLSLVKCIRRYLYNGSVIIWVLFWR